MMAALEPKVDMDLADFHSALYTGTISFVPPTVKYVDDFGTEIVLSSPDMFRGGAPLYQAFISFKALGEDVRAAIAEESSNTLKTSPLPERAVAACGAVASEIKDVKYMIEEAADVFPREIKDLREFLAKTRDTLARFPVLERWVSLYHPDVQGPIDAAEVVWGSDMFYAFYEAPALLKDFLSLVTDACIAFLRRWYEMVPQRSPYAVHWGLMHKGTIMLRNDSLMNLSPQAYVEFVRPMDERCFDAFGGGAVHFCGRGEHYIEPMSACRGLTAVNMGQPHMNDPEMICLHTIDKGIQLVGLFGNFPRREGRTLRGLAHRQG